MKSTRPAPLSGKMRVLIADDLIVNCKLLALKLNHCDVTFAHNGSSALETVQKSEKPFDLIFMDFNMPGGPNGIDTAKAIKTICPQTKIVLFTSESLNTLPPFNPDTFVDRLPKTPIDQKKLEEILNADHKVQTSQSIQRHTSPDTTHLKLYQV